MPDIILTRGLPGSGKSSWSREQIDNAPGKYTRVNKDDLRLMMDNGRWSKSNESAVLAARDAIIRIGLGNGRHVIVDDTNAHPKHLEAMKQIAKDYNNVRVLVQDFTHVPLDTCIERDLKRERSVGESVIRKMYREFFAPKPPGPPAHDPNLPDCIIVDIDGTAALMNGRGPFEWHRVDTDIPNESVRSVVGALVSKFLIVFVSGRDECCRGKTEDWLFGNYGFRKPLFMRPAGDTRDDRIVKREIYDREIKGRYNVIAVLDDRNRVVRQWREMGLSCFQVADGDF